MLLLVGHFRLPPENVAAAQDAFALIIAASRAEPGCLAYSFGEDVLDPGLFRVAETWVDRAALDVHYASPHMATFRREREALGMTEREIDLYEVGEPEAV
ncbi:MAG: antibiotic biosynthesis monooxygenase [Novosphingobium sp.]|nr:antibiotic biosynthesis monooxygenase [Novosphingobium sp.]